MRALVVGAGWAGCAAAWRLAQSGATVDVIEAAPFIGGHSRSEELCGVTYEAEGPHVFHTDDAAVMEWLRALGMAATWRKYKIEPLTEIDLGDEQRIVSWPIQYGELQALPCWPQIRTDLDSLPAQPHGDDLETWCVSLMGRTLYRLFIEDYTRKQWGREPSDLSAAIAPRRIDLRRDGFRPLHRNRWQFFPIKGPTGVMDRALERATVSCGTHATALTLADEPHDGFIVTAALDDFLAGVLDVNPLPWRGITLRSTFHPDVGTGTATPGHVVKRPSARVPYTRTIETKHATRQQVVGSVVSYEYPGAPSRHYPVHTTDGQAERTNAALQTVAAEVLDRPVAFAGRLATYQYIDMDEAIRSGWRAAVELLDQCAVQWRHPPAPGQTRRERAARAADRAHTRPASPRPADDGAQPAAPIPQPTAATPR